MNSTEKAKIAIDVIVDKKGFDLQLLDVAEITSIAEKFIICQAKNRSQSQAIADEIQLKMKADDGELPLRVEGYQGGGWILLDYSDLIIHIFLPDEQEYYKLPRLWKDAKFTKFDEEGNVIPEETAEEE
ncbi:MAG: ribosome silencing factor [Firmicutes bacterium]|nr:ribosome silencing factor [Bacillota bacterium]